ncbi:uncharacterized protein LOC143437551 isoform X2 [Arvicanthis niloticus]|uniref:uncharacterized protein LOC143310399 isoform X1 n=1 Tax=Arvicanthis niloticus TaxID=61156 RepID=UPI00402B8193
MSWQFLMLNNLIRSVAELLFLGSHFSFPHLSAPMSGEVKTNPTDYRQAWESLHRSHCISCFVGERPRDQKEMCTVTNRHSNKKEQWRKRWVQELSSSHQACLPLTLPALTVMASDPSGPLSTEKLLPARCSVAPVGKHGGNTEQAHSLYSTEDIGKTHGSKL